MLISQLQARAQAQCDNKLTDLVKYSKTLEFQRKIKHSLLVLSTFLEHTNRPLISCGGGKDGTAVALLAHILGAKVPIICANPPNPLPDRETHKDILKKWLGMTWIDLDYPWDVQAVLDGRQRYPDGLKMKRLSEYQKENHFDGVIFGIRAAESRGRAINLALRGEVYETPEGARCQPIARWTARDSLCLALLLDAPINPVYHKMDGCGDLEYLHDGTWWPHGAEDKGGWIRHYYPDYYDLYRQAERIGEGQILECRF